MKINRQLLDFYSIKKELENYVKSKETWNVFFESSSGNIILELLSAVLADKKFTEYIKIRESSLETANTENAIVNLAMSRGVYRPPAKPLRMKFEIVANSDISLSTDSPIGTYGDQFIYVTSPVTLKANQSKIVEVVFGTLEKFERVVEESKIFMDFVFETKNEFLSSINEKLFVNGDEIQILTQRTPLYYVNLDKTAQRICGEYFAKIIFGDGALGYKLNFGDKIIYQVLTFSDKMFNKFQKDKINLISDISLTDNMEVVEYAYPYMDKETLRRIALCYSVDGRWVTREDIENGLLYNFFNLLDDVYVEDYYPVDLINILPKQDLTEDQKNSIYTLVNNRKSLSSVFKYNIIPQSNGVDISINIFYNGSDDNKTINDAIDETIKQYKRKIIKENSYFLESDFCSEATKKLFRGAFYVGEENNKVKLKKYQFINDIKVNLIS